MDYEALIRDLEWEAVAFDVAGSRASHRVADNIRRAITAIQTLIVERDQARKAAPDLIAALKVLTDAPCSYAGSHIHIFCDSHADAMRRMREARAAISKATETPT